MTNIFRNIALSVLAVSAGCALAGSAQAAEVFQPTTPGGNHDIRAAELPPEPGLYFLGAFARTSNDKITDDSGNAIFPDTDQTVSVGGLGALYVFPDEIAGGRLGASLVFGYGTNDLVVTNLPVGPGGTPIRGDNTGLFDLTGELVWSKAHYNPPNPAAGPVPIPSGFAYSFGLGFTAPIGAFDGDKTGNPGFNNWVLSPSIAATWRSDPIWLHGTELSVRASYNHNFKREDSTGGFEYNDGDYVIADVALTERYNMFQFGVAGTMIKQIEDDEGSLAVPDGTRGRVSSLKAGPIVAIYLPDTSIVKMKYLVDIDTENTFEGNRFQVAYIKKF
ncbi:MAG: transporter [Pseudomonadota bacterium]|jgi:hypothetical protein|nr:transporter [Pseudomonadota bacterium]